WIKGSGWDLATIEPEGFCPVELGWVRRLRELPQLSDEDMVETLQTHKLRASAPSPSIETLLHAFLPHRYVDHSHADAILALTNLDNGPEVIRAALGDDVALVEYVKAGFDLAKLAADVYDAHPSCVGLVLLHHGLFTFGASARESYERHIELVRRAEAHLLEAASRSTYLPPRMEGSVARARQRAARIAPLLRGCLARIEPAGAPILVHRCDDALLAALEAPHLPHWGRSGPLTPDHVIRTKPYPLLLLEVDPDTSEEILREGLSDAVRAYAENYDAYFEACATRAGGIDAFVRLDPSPRVIWYPGVGLFAAGSTTRAAEITADLACHTLLLKQQASVLGPYTGLPPQDLFEMEYWSLEQAKLGRATAPPLARRVALVTGGAGAIGVGIARQLRAAGAHVILGDVDDAALERGIEELGPDGGLIGLHLDVGITGGMRAGLDEAQRRLGGIDLFVINAGIAVAGPLESLSDADLQRAIDVNLLGAHRTLRAAAQLFQAQGCGGDVVLISTKNVAMPGAAFGAYSATKAAAHQLARVAALELAPLGVRVNLVAPDAVFSEGSVRSGLWQQIGPDRAGARGLDEAALPGFYRDRNLLKATITGSDVGRAVVFFASGQTPTTGAVLPVDGGLPGAFPR
ncbi:MAG TPA: SDR family NAD(P)-dependent oxidoreductase, partial [Deltaproteobacteria bacterium]|nr:SDR family NAD(P)-dependent oxidoreductase [Deltaproteobacteria bacterium]